MHLLTLVLVVRLYDSFNVPAGQLQTATDVAARTLGQTGISVVWVPCSAAAEHAIGMPPYPCQAVPPRDGELSVRIARAPVGAPHDRALGYAAVERPVGPGALATIFMDRVRTLAQQAGIDEGSILGRAIAHELGHLMLGSTTHPGRGLMRAAWSVTELHRAIGADWMFSREEAAQLRAHVNASAGGKS